MIEALNKKEFYEKYKLFLMDCRRIYRIKGDHESAEGVTRELDELLLEDLGYMKTRKDDE
ncbi:hypothetical protein Q5741_02720 [Paenibacillus sp. JX-17]|uniref:Uncharacterized protein n=1 Tax=Paenibacillus lacisoli TaxID=3064525 RepID=A0ABT9C7W5_9BACL|nr:hypothetical protein [Paenibacillus sp. JX-17]MDO7905325.1 hypothetical protein [Paenibacillus sp. JX-17]